MRTNILKIAASLAFALGATQAFAHAQLEKATPAVGGTVSPPSEIRLEFSEGVEPKFTKVALTGPGGAVTLGAAHVEGADKTIFVTPIAKPLAPGVYHVSWHAVSVDTHHTQGTFDFTVKP
jgi:methionine-rich copper-binding protein CopC